MEGAPVDGSGDEVASDSGSSGSSGTSGSSGSSGSFDSFGVYEVSYGNPHPSITLKDFVGDKKALSGLANELGFDQRIALSEIVVYYNSIRQIMADNDSFRSFMFSYLEYILESQDTGEVERVKTNIEVCWDTLAEMGVDFPYDELFRQFYELLDSLIERGQAAISAEELLQKCRDPCYSNFIVMFLRCVTASQIYKYRDFYSSSYIDQCASPREMRTLEFDRALDPIGSVLGYPHPAHCAALANALGVPIMVVHLIPASLCDMDDSARHLVNLLCRDGHFDIIYRS